MPSVYQIKLLIVYFYWIFFTITDVQLTNKFGEADSFFNATHPFVFFVEELSTGTILFIGKMVNPLELDAVPIPSRVHDVNSLAVVPLSETPTSEVTTNANK